MSDKSSKNDTYSEAETVERREAALKQAFATPHKPHAKLGEGAETPSRRRSRQKPSG
ncbi:MAG: hypothetical protein H0W74_10595 [Sphingosinicella sp.]|nr:hypothetical protein [Sphingosinicella sp.]